MYGPRSTVMMIDITSRKYEVNERRNPTVELTSLLLEIDDQTYREEIARQTVKSSMNSPCLRDEQDE